MRTNFIQTINSAVREHDVNYSRLIYSLNNSNIQLDRKILANLAINEPFSFKAIVDELKI
jgi:large subunit ribosomal protein L20